MSSSRLICPRCGVIVKDDDIKVYVCASGCPANCPECGESSDIEDYKDAPTKTFQVNWSVSGIIEVQACDEEDAREQIGALKFKELEDKVKEEITSSFEIGTIESVEEE